jgi:phosphatidylglycerophosphatase A
MAEHSPFADKRGGSLTLAGPVDWMAFLVATGLGAGLIPLGPGTWGSVLGLLIAYGLVSGLQHDPIVLQNSLLLASLLLAFIGFWAGTRAEKIFNRKDAGQVVIDEVCGQVMTFVLITPYLARMGSQWRWWMLAGFLLFRAFDIFKPYPINQLQDLQGGVGVMMDDVLAGVYAAAALSLLLGCVV